MKTIYVPNSQIREFESNIAEIFDSREGVVMDSYVGELNDGRMFVALDTFETSWTSGLTVYFGNEAVLWEVWEDFANNYDAEYGYDEE